MATFYIQLENRLQKISGDLTHDNIVRALGYTPSNFSGNFNDLIDNPLTQDGNEELKIVDEIGNIIAIVNSEGIHSIDFIVGNHKLSDKTDKTYVDEVVKNVKVDLTGYATEEYVNNIDFYNINNNPIVNNGDDKLLFVDENGHIGLQLEEDGLYVKDVIADGHTLSQKADKSDIPSLDGYATESFVNTTLENYATKDEVSDLVDMSVVTELQGKVDKLITNDTDKSVRDIAVDVLTETLVSETATEAYDTLAEMSAWIKSHPEDAAAMNTAIQKNATDITNLDAAYKVADAKVLTDAQEYTDNINFFTIKDNPIVDNNDGNLTFVDESGNVGLQFSNNAILVNDVITPGHTLSNKADKLELEKKQDILVSGTNIKTINGQSLLGKGNIIIPQIIYIPNEALMPNPPIEGVLYLIGEEEEDLHEFYCTIEALEDDLTVSFSTNTIQYSTDNCKTWNELPANTATPAINTGDKISFKATGLTPNLNLSIGTFTVNKKFNLKGNVMSMLFGDEGKNSYDLTGYNEVFYELFNNCSTLQSVSKDFLPATTLADYCYASMFYGCTSLTAAPKLPATTLSNSCYNTMFQGCTSLVTAPELPATTLAISCYSYMFWNCTSLTTAPELPATTLANMCYDGMFSGCSSLNYIKALFTTNPNIRYTADWVSGVSSTGTFVKNADATWNVTGANGIPEGWTVMDDTEEPEDTPDMITFTVNGTKYYAEEGMTWEQWINSGYCTILDDISVTDYGVLYNTVVSGF